MQPASTVSVAFTASTSLTRFMRVSDRTTAPNGTPPPTRPVLPPCATTGTPAAAQAFTMAATSPVEPGRTAATAWPL